MIYSKRRSAGVRNGAGLFVPAILLLLSCNTYATSLYSFSLIPASGNVQGPAGSVVGWGYQITNDSTADWLVTEAVNAGLFQYAALDSGDYFDFPVIAPGQTVVVDFTQASNSSAGSGLAALTWAANAPLAFVNSGDFDLSACWAISGTGSCAASAPDALAPYSATVSQGTAPEPASKFFILVAAVIGLLGAIPRSKRRSYRIRRQNGAWIAIKPGEMSSSD